MNPRHTHRQGVSNVVRWSKGFVYSDGEPQEVGSRRFLIAVLAVLAVSMMLLAIMRFNTSTKALSTYDGPCLMVHGAQYDEIESYEELHDLQVMGLYPQEFRLGLNDESVNEDGKKVGDTLSYRFLGRNNDEHLTTAYFDARVKIVLTGLRGEATDYRITPKSSRESKVWNAYATIPRQRNLDNPVGTWRLIVESPKQSWKHTTWLTVHGDGTGEFGSIDKNANVATASELAKASHPCTVTCEKVSNGTRLVARYEGGTYVLTVTEA